MTNIRISPVISHHISGWKLIDKMLTDAIDANNEEEAKIFAETQERQSIALLKIFSADPNISSHFTNEVKYYIKYWCKQGVNAESNNNRIITIVDKILKLINGRKL